ncbi:ribonuclease H-like protein [Penicillium longicatenatum]|uniref:ribonuclease H-like protein n=1 Tax=Penicillium longicatenatum TaxID=1561947 RepID=UPI0025486166|nr:ribonuclease H-like protein [Penicillium longicatenatum]KAJ5635235.1 ribonuclease H-like protein [Penicillium longicatenatum]
MRLSATLFAGSRSRPVAALKPLGSTSTSTSSEFMPWLSSLKSTQLQRVARATGIQSSGTKGVLIQRIRDELRNNVQVAHETQPRDKSSREWRILSIDMGIRNLAFAFMVVPCPLSISSGSSAGTNPGNGQDQGLERINESEPGLPELQAWRRLSVLDGLSDLSTTSTAPTSDSELTDSITATKDSYSPAIYASTAYKLLTTLLSTHNPTHILIERQRFRSAGSSAVQEWTLRVGVFEGMLYAILHTLRQERGLDGIFVEGVEPKRVVGFWDEIGRNNTGTAIGIETVDGMKSFDGKRLTAREVKKAKVGIVGGWVEGSLDGSSDGKIVVGEDSGGREGGRKNGDVGKLDDLADCLLQGVTWLEWQVMRERIVREGMKALE